MCPLSVTFTNFALSLVNISNNIKNRLAKYFFTEKVIYWDCDTDWEKICYVLLEDFHILDMKKKFL